VHELGAFEKQSSMYFSAKTCRSNVHHNVFFNGPRAGVNVNDGFCGGHHFHANLIFNTCRESGDHGPFNSWDRQPFAQAPGEEPVPHVTEIDRNFVFADYQGVKGLDHDDGSSFYDDHSNVIFMGWGQKTFEPAPGAKQTHDSLILFASSVLTEHVPDVVPLQYAERFYNNTVVFAPGSHGGGGHYGSVDSLASLTNKALQLSSNTFYTDGANVTLSVGKAPMTLAQLQAAGVEVNSIELHTLPSDAAIVAMATELLGMP